MKREILLDLSLSGFKHATQEGGEFAFALKTKAGCGAAQSF